MQVNALGKCHPDCAFCARDFFKWLKTRMKQMDLTKNGETSFSQAAATSVRADR